TRSPMRSSVPRCALRPATVLLLRRRPNGQVLSSLPGARLSRAAHGPSQGEGRATLESRAPGRSEAGFCSPQSDELAARFRAGRVIAQAGPGAGGDCLTLADAAAAADSVVDHPGQRTDRIDGAQPTRLLDLDLAVDGELH